MVVDEMVVDEMVVDETGVDELGCTPSSGCNIACIARYNYT